MNLYLALDVGGTKTAAMLADNERVVARATSGSIKTMRILPSEAAASLKTLFADLEAQLGRPLRGQVARTCIGTSGISSPPVVAWMRTAFAEAVGGELLLLGDEVIALDAAFRGRRGVLVIAGTGSNIVGRAGTGEMAHTGGWGPALADEGSGHWIGTEALRACFRAIDAAIPSSADMIALDGSQTPTSRVDLPPLLAHMLDALQLQTRDDLIGTANAPGFASAALVPVVAEAARAGDPLASEVLQRAGHNLAKLVTAVIRKMEHFERATPSNDFPEVAFVGGILANVPAVWQAMQTTLNQHFPGIAVQRKPVDPLDGALWHARSRP
jgi:glucosamine kinase